MMSPNRALLLFVLIATLASGESTKLTWLQSRSAPVSSNNVYRGDISGGPYTEIFESTGPIIKYVDTTVVDGQTYCWVVTAVSNGVESPFSNEACETITTQAPSSLKAK
jgi:fibronectin type 3 domain-containing protein